MSYSDMQLKMIKTFVCKNKKVLGLVGGGWLKGMWVLSSLDRDQTVPLTLEVPSLNYFSLV